MHILTYLVILVYIHTLLRLWPLCENKIVQAHQSAETNLHKLARNFGALNHDNTKSHVLAHSKKKKQSQTRPTYGTTKNADQTNLWHHEERRPDQPMAPRRTQTRPTYGTTKNADQTNLWHHEERRPDQPMAPRRTQTRPTYGTTKNADQTNLWHHEERRPDQPMAPRRTITEHINPHNSMVTI